MRNPTERLRDILDAIANIERYSVRGRGALSKTSWFGYGFCITFRLLVRQRHNWVGFFTRRTLKFHGRRLLPCEMY
jgi:hypothetical protein